MVVRKKLAPRPWVVINLATMTIVRRCETEAKATSVANDLAIELGGMWAVDYHGRS